MLVGILLLAQALAIWGGPAEGVYSMQLASYYIFLVAMHIQHMLYA